MDNNWNFKTLGKDCGSMNMEELLMNVYIAEETQGVVPPNGANEGLQRQDSITLPRILSQKTIEEVWKYITEEEEEEEEDTNNDGGRTNYIPQIQRQQQTLGDITLEEFLTRAGATGNNTSGGYIHDPSSLISGNLNASSSVGVQKKPMVSVSDVLNNIVPRKRNQMQQLYGFNLHPNGNVFMSTYHQQQNQKPHGYGYGTQPAFTSGAMGVNTCSPVTSYPLLDGIPKINVGSSLVSPFAYTISGSNSVRERKRNNCIAVEKTQRRMIKNRESAARSRGRKQAQSMKLEAEVEKLRKENHELLKKQAEISKMQLKLRNGLFNRSTKQLRRTKSDIQ